MNAKEIKLKIDALEKELETLNGELKENMESKWPQRGDFYYFIFRGDWYRSMWKDHDIDFRRKEFNNVFSTMDEAKKEASYLTFESQVRAKAKELNDGWVADYSDKTQPKFWLMNQGDFVCIQESFKHSFPIVRGSECKSREAVQALNDQFGEDKLLAYATGGDL